MLCRIKTNIWTTFFFRKIGKNKPFVQKQPAEMFLKKELLKNLTKFKGKHLCWSLFFNKDPGLRPATLLRKRLQQRFFPWILWSFQEHLFTEHFPTTSSFSNLSHSSILQRSFMYLFEPSFVRKVDKNSQFWHLFILQIHFILYIAKAFYIIDQNINRRNYVSIVQEY